MKTTGYGIILSNYTIKEDAVEKILQMVKEKTDYLKGLYHEFCDENSGDYETEREMETAFVDKYENDIYMWSGIKGLICDLINEVEFGNLPIFRYEDGCLYVEPTIPGTDSERATMPTRIEIADILNKYLSPIIGNPLKIDWLEINQDNMF